MFISSIIFTLFAGILSASSLYSTENTSFAQISKNANLSEINPLESLGKAALPLDSIWNALKTQFKTHSPTEDIKNSLNTDSTSSEASKSALDDSFKERLDNVSLWQALGIVKSIFIVVANVLVTMMEISIKTLKFILGLIT